MSRLKGCTVPGGRGSGLAVRWLGLGALLGLACWAGCDETALAQGPRRPDRQAAPPACTYRGQAQAPRGPAARSMPEMFGRMAERMARDPASGFGGFLDDLAELEGPALAGVRLSREQERQYGLKARADYLQRAAARGYRLVDDPARLGYLESLVAGISRQMRNRERYPAIQVQLIEAPVPDAQSFPGGFLVFTSALLQEPDEATVAAVVAHELAHLDRGHLYQYARRAMLAEATYGPGTMAGPAGFDRFMTRQMALFGLMMHPFRPEHEHEADCDAVTWLYRDGYDPEALADFFTRLNARRRDTPEAALPFFEMLRSHPYSLERREHVQRRLSQLQRWKPRGDLERYPENLKQLESRYEVRDRGEGGAAQAVQAAPLP